MKLASLIPLVAVVALHGAQDVQRLTLPNGLRILLREDHRVPVLRMEMRSLWTASEVPAERRGMSGLLGRVLETCPVGPLSRDAFEVFLADHALQYAFSLEPGSMGWSVRCASGSQEAAFQALSWAATRPALTTAAIDQARQHLGAVLAGRSRSQQAEAFFHQLTGDPRAVVMPDSQSLARIGSGDLDVLVRRIIRPESSVLVIQGDMNLMQVKQMAAMHLGAWGPTRPQPLVADADVKAPVPASRAWLVQTVGQPIRIRLGSSHAPLAALSVDDAIVMQHILRQRVQDALQSREESGTLTFHPNGTWQMDLQAKRMGTLRETVRTALILLEALRRNDLQKGELESALRAREASRLVRPLHPGLAMQSLVRAGLEQASSRNLRALDAASFRELSAEAFDADKLRVFVTGDAPGADSVLKRVGWTPLAVVE